MRKLPQGARRGFDLDQGDCMDDLQFAEWGDGLDLIQPRSMLGKD